MCVLKLSLKSMVTPSSFTSLSQLMLQPFKLSVILCLCVLSPIAIAWNCPGFDCILFTENHEIREALSSSKGLITVAKE